MMHRPPVERGFKAPLRQGSRLLRSAGVRFAVAYTVLLAISASVLALLLWWETAGLLDRQTEAAIRADAQGLAERWTEGGLPAMALTIDDRLATNVDDDAIYLLVDSQFHRLAGNLQTWPTGVPDDGATYPLTVSRAGTHSLALVQQFHLPGGFHLLVGRDARLRAKLRAMLTDALVWAVALVAILAAIGAWLVRLLFGRTLADVSATSAAISAGDLTQRVPRDGTGDEFDLLAETINDMLDRIARLMDGVRQVSNAIAHDLRTPIARARTRLEDASLHATTEAELRAAIDRATSDLDGIVAVFQALLRIAEIEAGSRRSAFAPLDLGPVLADLGELYAAVAEERGVRLDVIVPAALAVMGDRELIQQAVANLLDNAIKFSPEGGAIQLAAQPVAAGVEITVSDQGPGIPPEELAHATERFYRGEAARSTPGSGLGLALVQAVAQLHGGALQLIDVDPGLCAVLLLAVGEPAARPASPSARVQPVLTVSSSSPHAEVTPTGSRSER